MQSDGTRGRGARLQMHAAGSHEIRGIGTASRRPDIEDNDSKTSNAEWKDNET